MPKDEYTIEELVNMKVFTRKEAVNYVKEKTGMGEGLFDNCIRPLLTFQPLVKNFKHNRPSHKVVLKKHVDEVIARKKKKLLD